MLFVCLIFILASDVNLLKNALLNKQTNEEERKEANVLFNDTLNTLYLWHQTYGKGPLRLERKPVATTTWADLFN